MSVIKRIIISLILILMLVSDVTAHPGRLDSNGGHYNRKTGEYHYHRDTGRSSSSRSNSALNSTPSISNSFIFTNDDRLLVGENLHTKEGISDYNMGLYAEAAKYFRIAAEQGDASAQNNLGVLYEMGKGVEQDEEEALKWYLLAGFNGTGNVREAALKNLAALPNAFRYPAYPELFGRKLEPPEQYQIRGDKANVKYLPFQKANIYRELAIGNPCTASYITEMDGGTWYYIDTAYQCGWIHSKYLEPKSDEWKKRSGTLCEINGQGSGYYGFELHSAPTDESDIIMSLNSGYTVIATGRKEKDKDGVLWFEVYTPALKSGWVSEDAISFD